MILPVILYAYMNLQTDDKARFNQPKKRAGRFFLLNILLFLLVVSGLVFLSLRWISNRQIKKVNITGNMIIPATDITDKISDSVLNTTNESLKLGYIKEKLNDNPFIEQSNITRKGADEINVDIKERIPVAIVVYNDGNPGFIDKNGKPLPYRLFSKFADLPLVRNIYYNDKIDSRAVSNSLNIIAELKKGGNSVPYHYISEIVYNNTDDTFTLISTVKNIKIYLGNICELEKKIKKLSDYWLSRMAQDVTGSAAFIDLRWTNRVVVGFENKVQKPNVEV